MCLDSLVRKTMDRISLVIDLYPFIYTSFSGGKDSTVLSDLVMQVCNERDRLFTTIFNDIETIAPEVNEYVESKKELYNVKILQPNSIDRGNEIYPKWIYWDPKYQGLWCKERTGIPLEGFNGDWYKVFDFFCQNNSGGLPYCNFIGIRGQESFHRNMATSRTKKNNPINWLYDNGSKARAYPLYDWRWNDIWDYILDHGLGYNKTYDYWTDAGVKHSKSRTAALYDASEPNKGRWSNFFVFEKYNPDFYQKVKRRMEVLGVDFTKIKNSH